ncbi:hypothetical protein ADK41_25610 [Streptomyces caelestis]|uniref:Uncharacterized protein n=2 Tax=Streptomyces TaxID=1883 RepID=A0A0M8QGE0_9ACTN|nr:MULTISPECIES: hypothetical protein [Streptomyces]KOT34998.1 hypothetical protein ADK41_25610 [Streptomyces caelestis]
MTQEFHSDRTFTLWHYTAAHGDRLLLRAKAEADKPRIDLHVEGVRGFMLTPIHRGLTIRRATAGERQRVEAEFGVDVDEAATVHVIGARHMRGFVVGGPLRWHEDNGDFRDPSHFGPIPGTP